MSHSNQTAIAAGDYQIQKNGLLWNAWKISGAVAAVGLLGAAVGFAADKERFAFSYLFAFLVTLLIGLGSLFFIAIQYATGAGWSITVRRTFEYVASAIPVMAILFLPILGSVKVLYPWSHMGGEHHGAHHAAAPNEPARHEHGQGHDHAAMGHHAGGQAGGHADVHGGHHSALPTPEEAQHHETMGKKAPYLNVPFFTLRAGIYFTVWLILSMFFSRRSFKQDETHDLATTRSFQRWAPLSLFALGLTITFSGFDWIMSLEPNWYSTIFGVYLFASALVSSISVAIVLSMAVRSEGRVGEAISVEHYHDLGKLLFGFVVFWAYIGFSQLLLIWYVSMPEETTYYHTRWQDGGWRMVSALVLGGQFVVPFLFLLSRNIKRSLGMLRFGASWLIVMHVVVCYWFVMPYANSGRYSLNMVDGACLMFIAGTYLTLVLRAMRKHALIPVGDPRLARSMQFEGA